MNENEEYKLEGNVLIKYSGNTESFAVPETVEEIADDCFINSNLKEIKLPEGLKKIGRKAFYNCRNLTSLVLPESVSELGEFAFGATSLISFEIPEQIKKIPKSLFSACRMLKEVKMSDDVSNIGASAFWGCCALENLVLPKNISVIREATFCGCRSLENIVLPESIEIVEKYAFSKCTALKKAVLPSSMKNIPGTMFCDCNKLQYVKLPERLYSIGYQAFASCSGLEEIIIPDTVRIIEYEAFMDCKKLKKISFPEAVQSLGFGICSGCSALGEVKLPENIKSIGKKFFDGCDSLKKVTIPKKLKGIGFAAFRNCRSLKNIDLPGSVERIEAAAFYNCCELEKIYLPARLKFFGNRTDGGPLKREDDYSECYAYEETDDFEEGAVFGNCEKLRDISVDKNNKAICAENGIIFSADKKTLISCPAMSDKITIPAEVNELSSYAFVGCENLNSMVLHSKKIHSKENTFYSVDSISKLILMLPDGVKITEECLTRIFLWVKVKLIVAPELSISCFMSDKLKKMAVMGYIEACRAGEQYSQNVENTYIHYIRDSADIKNYLWNIAQKDLFYLDFTVKRKLLPLKDCNSFIEASEKLAPGFSAKILDYMKNAFSEEEKREYEKDKYFL